MRFNLSFHQMWKSWGTGNAQGIDKVLRHS